MGLAVRNWESCCQSGQLIASDTDHHTVIQITTLLMMCPQTTQIRNPKNNPQKIKRPQNEVKQMV
eukprot:5237345-Amphidinium_carterae.1